MRGRRRDPTKVALWARRREPIPARWRHRHPGANKRQDSTIRKLRSSAIAASAGAGNESFGDLLTQSQRGKIDFSFDWSIANGDRNPALMVVIAARLARDFLQRCPDAEESPDVAALLKLIEKYPGHAIAYAAARVTSFERRYGDTR